MNFKKLVIQILFVILSFFLVTGCDKDEFEGELHLSFTVAPLYVDIYAAENTETPIMVIDTNERDTSVKVTLNVGNYIIEPYVLGHYYDTKGVQIRAGETTSVIFD